MMVTPFVRRLDFVWWGGRTCRNTTKVTLSAGTTRKVLAPNDCHRYCRARTANGPRQFTAIAAASRNPLGWDTARALMQEASNRLAMLCSLSTKQPRSQRTLPIRRTSSIRLFGRVIGLKNLHPIRTVQQTQIAKPGSHESIPCQSGCGDHRTRSRHRRLYAGPAVFFGSRLPSDVRLRAHRESDTGIRNPCGAAESRGGGRSPPGPAVSRRRQAAQVLEEQEPVGPSGRRSVLLRRVRPEVMKLRGCPEPSGPVADAGECAGAQAFGLRCGFADIVQRSVLPRSSPCARPGAIPGGRAERPMVHSEDMKIHHWTCMTRYNTALEKPFRNF